MNSNTSVIHYLELKWLLLHDLVHSMDDLGVLCV